jgi:hypothetical protein
LNLLFFCIFEIFSLFNLLFFHIFQIIALFNWSFFHIFSIFFSIQLTIPPYFPNLCTIQFTFLS